MRGGIFPSELDEVQARALIAAEPTMRGRDLAREVTPRESFYARVASPGTVRRSP